jgi:tetratricopeptide (TPR) repeat protein
MNEAITLNNQGVQRLQEGDYSSALSDLKQAAELMHAALKVLEGSGTIPAEVIQYEGEENSRAYISAVPAKEEHVLSSSENFVFLHDTPFRIPSSVPSNKAGATIVIAIVLYNMALTYHISFCQSYSIPRSNEYAISLYKMACNIGRKYCGDVNMMSIVMACMNNLGYLHYELGQFECAKIYLDDLARYITTLGEESDGRAHQLQKNEFMLNAVFLRKSHPARAA